MAFTSLGGTLGTVVSFDFDVPFEILSTGPGYYPALLGGGVLEKTDAGVSADEGDGVVQFDGTFTAIHWTVPVGENWSGFTVGVRGP